MPNNACTRFVVILIDHIDIIFSPNLKYKRHLTHNIIIVLFVATMKAYTDCCRKER